MSAIAKRCAGRVYSAGTWGMTACNRKPSIQEPDEKGVARDWCAAHAPSRVAARRVKRDEKRKEKDAIRRKVREAEAREMRRRADLDLLLPDLIAALGEHPLALRLRELLP